MLNLWSEFVTLKFLLFYQRITAVEQIVHRLCVVLFYVIDWLALRGISYNIKKVLNGSLRTFDYDKMLSYLRTNDEKHILRISHIGRQHYFYRKTQNSCSDTRNKHKLFVFSFALYWVIIIYKNFYSSSHHFLIMIDFSIVNFLFFVNYTFIFLLLLL